MVVCSYKFFFYKVGVNQSDFQLDTIQNHQKENIFSEELTWIHVYIPKMKQNC